MSPRLLLALDRGPPPRRLEPGLVPLDHNEGPAPAACVVRAAQSLAGESLRRYRDPRELELLIAGALGLAADQVIVTAGADEAIDRCARASLGPDRAMVLAEPTFPMFRHHAALARAEVASVPWPPGRFPRAAVLEAIARTGERTALVPIVTPNNPTGETASGADLEAIAAAAPAALIVVDHAYVEYGGEDLTARALALDNAVVLRTFSKARGLAGCRVGFALGPEPIIAALRAAGGPYPVAAPSLALAAAQWQHGDDALAADVRQTIGERDRLARSFAAAGVETRGSQANFVTASLGSGARSLDAALRDAGFAIKLLEDALAGWVRITMPVDEPTFARLTLAVERWLARRADRPEGEPR